MDSKYITTPIFYVNDLPHIGHAYTVVICDAIARFFRLDGENVLFTTGTDEHGMKVEKAAKNKKKPPQEFVDKVSKNFKELAKKLNISNTDFVRTTESRHKSSATFFWNELKKNNQIYLSMYKGWYSVKDESFYQEKELLKDGDQYKTHDGSLVEWVEEESFFFKLSEWQGKLIDFYNNNPHFVQPESRFNEVKSFVKSGLKDLSVSRTSFNWGIKIPESNNHIMYVWIDALTNYLTSIGYPKIDSDKISFWKNCIHIIGKDILKFHAVYWPAMLMSINHPLPKTIFAHGWWTNEGKKISKSIGNTIDPNEMIDKFGIDQLRYFLLREVPLGNDGDFSEKAFINRINSDLSNNLGNLIQRVVKFLNKNFDNVVPIYVKDFSKETIQIKKGYELIKDVRKIMRNFQISKSLEEIFFYIDNLNKFMNDSKPWESFKNNPDKAGKDISILIESFRILGIILQPFIPLASKNILDILNIDESSRKFKFLTSDHIVLKGHKLNSPKPLFPRYEE
jgi:methionyl-tRNA synthetase